MSASHRTEFRETWARLFADPVSNAGNVRVHALDRATPWGSVALAVDNDDVRHLLVPILSSTTVRSGLDGPGLMLRKRILEDVGTHTTFADLSCHRPELQYLFDDLCSDVLVEIEGLEHQPMRALYMVVDRWRSLFDRPVGVLSDESAAGLYGELLVLRRLLESDGSAYQAWTGPQGARHDFVCGSVDIEVKTTSLSEGRIVRIHGLDQLEAPDGGQLLLAVFRLADSHRSGNTTTLLSLAEAVLALADDELSVRSLMAQAGYIPGTVESNDTRGYTVTDERWYEVNDAFPRLTRSVLTTAEVPETVVDVDYSIDLAAELPAPVPAVDVAKFLSTRVSRIR